jgi:ERCC4-type nuclease
MPHIGQSAHIIADNAQQGRLAERVEQIQGTSVEYEALDAGDYILSDEVAVDYKSGTDFILAVVEQELFETANRLKAQYAKPVFLVEGDYFTHRFHQTPFDVHWAISYLAAVLDIPVLYSPEAEHSAMFIYTLAVRAQGEAATEQPWRPTKPETRRETIRFLVEGLPGVNPELARDLLRHFGTARGVFAASKEDLLAVDGMTDKIASRITDVLDSKKGK